MLDLYQGRPQGRITDPSQDATPQQADLLLGTYLLLGEQVHLVLGNTTNHFCPAQDLNL